MSSTLVRAAAIAGATLLSTSLFAEIRIVPNTVKYRNSGIPNATGRSGSASIEARALLGRNGMTHVELTTGSFERDGASGSIDKVQLKTGSATLNFNNLQNDGTATLTSDGLVRHQPLHLQTNVSGIDGARTGVVSVSTLVRLRPDVAVTAISAPVQVPPNAAVAIHATVRELNGDSGARANARLLVDGVETDRAENIWVDAGGNVSVAFSHSFSAYGDASLTVVVENLDPADWHDANNSAGRAIEVAEELDVWSVHAVERHSNERQRSKSPLWDNNVVMSQTDQQTEMYGWIRHPVNFSSFSISTSASTDGLVLYDVPNVPFRDRFRRTNNGALCMSADTWYPRVEVCYQPMSSSFAPNGFMLFEVRWGLSDVIYHSWGYSDYDDPWDPYDEPRGVYEISSVRKETKGPFGNTVQWDFRFTDGDGVVYHDRPFLSSLPARQSQLNFPWRCRYSEDFGFEICSEYYSQSARREGWATGINN